jgi:hypothetical protein|nr:MAG TPA: hypothetical protein [Caudoviricetes sp.]
METEINIVEILKDKPANTKLYSPLFSEVFFSHVSGGYIAVEHHGGTSLFLSSGRFYDYDGSEPLLFPSKEMRDWNKFAWQKGDILVNENNAHIIFEKFTDDTYTTFIGRHYLNKNYKNYVPGRYTCVTQHFHIEESNAAQIYIYNIEEKIGGKLDLKTLEIEKPKCEFKTFDKVLGRNEKDDVWEADLFSHYREESQYPFRCIGFSRKYCIPYEGNEHLLGTRNNPE